MREAVRQTRSYLMDLFGRHGFNPRTDLGQNFLIDLNILEFIVSEAEIGLDDVILEIGAGTGGMTTFMAQQAAAVVSVEVDPNMYALASETTAGFTNISLLNIDALKNKNQFAPEVVALLNERLSEDSERRMKLVANLPYNIATPVVSNMVATDLPWDRMVITIQWELAERMAAKPRTSQYGSLSVWLQSQCRVKILKRLPPTVFWPRPKVTSAIVRILPDPRKRDAIVNRVFFQDFLRRLFQQRRKLLRSGLVGMYRKQMDKPEIDEVLAAAGLPADARAEQLDVRTLVDLSNRFCQRLTKT